MESFRHCRGEVESAKSNAANIGDLRGSPAAWKSNIRSLLRNVLKNGGEIIERENFRRYNCSCSIRGNQQKDGNRFGEEHH